jgi:hypothetical protein
VKNWLETLTRRRTYVLVLGSLLVILWHAVTSPTGITLVFLESLITPVTAVWFSYLASRAIFDSISVGELVAKAKETATGSAVTFLGICLVLFGLLGLFGNSARAQDVTTYIPTQAYIHMPVLKAEQERLWADHPKDGTYQG